MDFADGDAIVPVSGAVYNYGKNINDECLVKLGASLTNTKPKIMSWFDVYDNAQNILTEKEKRGTGYKPPYIRDAWMPVSEVMTARETENSEKGLFVAAKAGHNGESHNHNDIGNFIVYMDGRPVIIDLGTEEYTAKTFSPDRFDLWYLQSQFHNCPTINGFMQRDGKEYRAQGVKYTKTAGCSGMEADISGAYQPEAGIVYWRRLVGLNRDGGAFVEVVDEYQLKNNPAEVKYHFMLAVEPSISGEGEITLRCGDDGTLLFIYDFNNLKAEIEKIEITESRLLANWGNIIYRITFIEKTPASKGKRVFRIAK